MYNMLCMPTATAMGKGDFDLPHLGNHLTDFDDTST